MLNQNPNKIINNLVLELHIPNFEIARKFYALFGFKEIGYDPTSGGGSDLGYMVIKRDDSIGNTLINFYSDKDKVSQHKYFADFPSNTPKARGSNFFCLLKCYLPLLQSSVRLF